MDNNERIEVEISKVRLRTMNYNLDAIMYILISCFVFAVFVSLWAVQTDHYVIIMVICGLPTMAITISKLKELRKVVRGIKRESEHLKSLQSNSQADK